MSTAFKHQPRKVQSRQQVLARSRTDAAQSSQPEDWFRQSQSSVQSRYADYHSNSNSKTGGMRNGDNSRWHPGRTSCEPANLFHGPRSSSSLSHLRSRPEPNMLPNYRFHRHPESVSLQSIYDEEAEKSDGNDSEPLDHVSHHSSRESNRPPRSVGGSQTGSNTSKDFDIQTMTKRELMSTVMKQRDKYEKIKAKFAADRDSLLDALERSREMEAELSREKDRLVAEDAWKTEELNKAREEIGWLSRLADSLELEKSRLETRANSMANELKRAVVDLRTASSASSQISHADNHGDRRSNNDPMSRSIRKSSYSLQSNAEMNITRSGSTESIATICRQGSNYQLHASKSPINLGPKVSPRTREFRHDSRPSTGLVQRSVADLRSPLSPLKMSFQRFDRHNHNSPQGPRRSSTLRSVSSGQALSDDQERASMDSDEGGHRSESVTEDSGHRSIPKRLQLKSTYQDRKPSRVMDYPLGSPKLDGREEVEAEEGELGNEDGHSGLSRKSSSSSLAISPSSTVFADHDRKRRSQRMTMSSGLSQDLDHHSHHHSQRSSQFRSSLISLQLRPEDELFLENYLEDHDGIDSDDDF